MNVIARIKDYFDSFGRNYNWHNMGTGIPLLEKLRCFECRLIHKVNTDNYVAMELYRKRHAEIRTYMGFIQSQKITKKMRKASELSERRSIGNKLLFNQTYGAAGFVKRDFLGTETASEDEIRAFVEKHEAVFKKPLYQSGGAGIELLRREDLSEEDLAELKRRAYVLEERIRQHRLLNEINPSCVNTVRIVTILDKDRNTQFVGAALRCGAAGSIVDNMHFGGIAYPIDLKTGRITGPGRDNETERSHDTHPSSGMFMIGLQLPNWDILLHEVSKAAQLSKNMIYLGWDIAITEDGVDFIEANFGHGVDVIQYDNVGKKEIMRKYLKGTPCEF